MGDTGQHPVVDPERSRVRPAFVLLGIGTEIVAVAILMTFFKRRGWF